MVICLHVGGVKHCYDIVEILYPIAPYRPGPGPVNYPQLFRDATLVASLSSAVSEISDEGVKEALTTGYHAAVDALRKRAGAHVTISVEQGR